MHLESLSHCELVIGDYPSFHYDARGGGGITTQNKTEDNGSQSVSFDPESFRIPPLNWKTTKFLGLPMPPGLEIEIVPRILNGTFNLKSGYMSLILEADFVFSIFSLIKAPELKIKTCLNTEELLTENHKMGAQTIQSNGRATLTGVARVPRTGQKYLDTFLSLPNDATAKLHCKFTDLNI